MKEFVRVEETDAVAIAVPRPDVVRDPFEGEVDILETIVARADVGDLRAATVVQALCEAPF